MNNAVYYILNATRIFCKIENEYTEPMNEVGVTVYSLYISILIFALETNHYFDSMPHIRDYEEIRTTLLEKLQSARELFHANTHINCSNILLLLKVYSFLLQLDYVWACQSNIERRIAGFMHPPDFLSNLTSDELKLFQIQQEYEVRRVISLVGNTDNLTTVFFWIYDMFVKQQAKDSSDTLLAVQGIILEHYQPDLFRTLFDSPEATDSDLQAISRVSQIYFNSENR